jgi:L-lactate dehydrogenase
LVERAPDAVLLLVTNPVDVITYVTLQVSGLPARRVFGSGTVLDSSRFRVLLGARCGVAVQNVHAYIVGEHGDSEIPLWSSASIAHIPVQEWPLPGGGRLSADDRDEIFTSVRDAAYRIVRGKGATNYAIGLASTQILEAVVNDERRVLPVSSRLDGYRDVADVCLSVPCVVDGGGVAAPLEVPMDDGEVEGLRSSAAAIRAAIRAVGF